MSQNDINIEIQSSSTIYHLCQGEFGAIPSNPWVYWIGDSIRVLFRLRTLGKKSRPLVGLQTSDNFRFLRYWWEIGIEEICYKYPKLRSVEHPSSSWFPIVKGGPNITWFGNNEYVVNWADNGREVSLADGAVIRNPEFYFKEGITFNRFAGNKLAVRWLPPGFIFDCNGPSLFGEDIGQLLPVLNSEIFSALCYLINPTINFQVGDVIKVPIVEEVPQYLIDRAYSCLRLSVRESLSDESSFLFVGPDFSFNINISIEERRRQILTIEQEISKEVYGLYGLSTEDREAIKTNIYNMEVTDEEKDDEKSSLDSEDSLSVNRNNNIISFAVGIIQGVYCPGKNHCLGSTIYDIDDFILGSTTNTSEEEYSSLVGQCDKFAYVDDHGGRHVFSREVEHALQTLTIPDGIAVTDPGHPRDLAALVQKALGLMLGETGAQEVIDQATGGDLRKYLEKDYFTQYHLKLYRKRPIYWYIQSAKRSYGFVIFHERITRDTFYALQRDPYLDTKRRSVALQIEDTQAQLNRAAGSTRKKMEKDLAELHALSDELAQFAKDLEEITRGGYEPEENWIDDGVILRMAPLWKVIPLWKSEPKKYWDRLAAGDFDWSHIAMKYWPERVKKACKNNKSYAIAHEHEEWYEGR